MNGRKILNNSIKKVLVCIKYALNYAPQPVKLLAHSSLCWLILEYANVLWDPADATSIHKLEAVQNKAIRFVKSIGGRHCITDSSWTTRAKGQKKVSQIRTDDHDPLRR